MTTERPAGVENCGTQVPHGFESESSTVLYCRSEWYLRRRLLIAGSLLLLYYRHLHLIVIRLRGSPVKDHVSESHCKSFILVIQGPARTSRASDRTIAAVLLAATSGRRHHDVRYCVGRTGTLDRCRIPVPMNQQVRLDVWISWDGIVLATARFNRRISVAAATGCGYDTHQRARVSTKKCITDRLLAQQLPPQNEHIAS